MRITHKPSGIVVSMQDEKSQLQNREKAMRVLRARLYERALAEQQAELSASRSAQVGSGDRSEKIRTYNYGERRVKDHRINLLLHNLDGILMGELDEFTDALQDDEKRRRLEDAAAARDHAARGARRPPPRRWPRSAVTRRGSTRSCCSRACSASTAPDCVMRADEEVSGDDRTRYLALLTRRVKREPIAYILGRKDFRRLTLVVDPRVLIPRPETELLVEVGLTPATAGARVPTSAPEAVPWRSRSRRSVRTCEVVGVDVSSGRAVGRADERPATEACRSTWSTATCSTASICDAVLANLPYIADDELLPPEVALYEPRGALLGGKDGLDLVRRLIEQVGERPEVALIALEIGHTQAAATAALLAGGRIRPDRAAARPGGARAGGRWGGDERVRARDRGRWGGAVPLRHRLRTCV